MIKRNLSLLSQHVAILDPAFLSLWEALQDTCQPQGRVTRGTCLAQKLGFLFSKSGIKQWVELLQGGPLKPCGRATANPSGFHFPLHSC